VGVGGPGPGKPTAPEPLSDQHDVSTFNSGEPELDEWLRRRAHANQASGASRTYVTSDGRVVIGYFSLAAGAIAIAEAPGRIRRNMPDPIPTAVLGRLAIDHGYQHMGLGRLLLRDALFRTRHAAEAIGIRALLVHAISPRHEISICAAAFINRPPAR
jgi:GNAT superfamily N-acetyltransferase